MGYSFGNAIAIGAMADPYYRDLVDQVFLIAPFTNLMDVILNSDKYGHYSKWVTKAFYPAIWSAIFNNRWDSLKRLQDEYEKNFLPTFINVPELDEVIPRSQQVKIQAAMHAKAAYLRGCDHHNARNWDSLGMSPAFRKIIREFFGETDVEEAESSGAKRLEYAELFLSLKEETQNKK